MSIISTAFFPTSLFLTDAGKAIYRGFILFSVCDMTRARAASVMAWSYPEPYTLYSFTAGADTEAELMDGSYRCVMINGVLAGFFCFGQAAQIPVKGLRAHLVYTENYLDIGLGMAPDYCGRGLGPAFLQCGIDHARRHLYANKFRLSVAAFNRRAIKVYERAGFKLARSVKHAGSGLDFKIMTL